jgi:hypothetical protein
MPVTRKTYGLIAGLIAAGVGSWFWRSRRHPSAASGDAERGSVIFDNTPQASTPDGNLDL